MSADGATSSDALEGCGYCGPYCPRCTSRRANAHGWVVTERLSAALGCGPDGVVAGIAISQPGDPYDAAGAQMLARGVAFVDGDVSSRLQLTRPNRHDLKRAARGDYCVFGESDAFPFEPFAGARDHYTSQIQDHRVARSTPWLPPGGDCPMPWETVQLLVTPEHPHRGRRVRTVGEEWALMCRRVLGAVAGTCTRYVLEDDTTVEVLDGAGRLVRRELRADVAPDDINSTHRTHRGRGRRDQLLRAVADGGWDGGGGDIQPGFLAGLILARSGDRRLVRAKYCGRRGTR